MGGKLVGMGVRDENRGILGVGEATLVDSGEVTLIGGAVNTGNVVPVVSNRSTDGKIDIDFVGIFVWSDDRCVPQADINNPIAQIHSIIEIFNVFFI